MPKRLQSVSVDVLNGEKIKITKYGNEYEVVAFVNDHYTKLTLECFSGRIFVLSASSYELSVYEVVDAKL